MPIIACHRDRVRLFGWGRKVTGKLGRREGPEGDASRRGAEAQRREWGKVRAVSRNRLGPLETVYLTYFPKRQGLEHGPYPPSWPGRKRHCVLCGRLSGWGREGDGKGERSELFPATGSTVNLANFPKRQGLEHGPYPPSWPGRKRHCVLCGRLSGWGGKVTKGSGCLFGRTLGAIILTAGDERLSLPNRMVHRMNVMSDEQRPME
jgi:hypothetical protein